MQIFGWRETETKQLIRDHVEVAGKTVRLFRKMFFAYLNENERYDDLGFEVHNSEHRADEIRREVERQIYEGAFMPSFREDYILFIELIDAIADQAEVCADMIAQQKPHVPEEIKSNFKEMIQEIPLTYRPFQELVREKNMNDARRANELIDKIEASEQAVDRMEWGLIKDVFANDSLSLAQKIHLRNFIALIAGISDRVEDASDRVIILMARSA
ncbi:MAG: TIGR00153 family protein [bacterium]